MTHAFRDLVRDCVADWLRKHGAGAELLLHRIADGVAPIVAEAVQKGIFQELGQLEQSERQKIVGILAGFADRIAMLINEKNFETVDRLKIDVHRAAKAIELRTEFCPDPDAMLRAEGGAK
jgi:hypothetical protein